MWRRIRAVDWVGMNGPDSLLLSEPMWPICTVQFICMSDVDPCVASISKMKDPNGSTTTSQLKCEFRNFIPRPSPAQPSLAETQFAKTQNIQRGNREYQNGLLLCLLTAPRQSSHIGCALADVGRCEHWREDDEVGSEGRASGGPSTEGRRRGRGGLRQGHDHGPQLHPCPQPRDPHPPRQITPVQCATSHR